MSALSSGVAPASAPMTTLTSGTGTTTKIKTSWEAPAIVPARTRDLEARVAEAARSAVDRYGPALERLAE